MYNNKSEELKPYLVPGRRVHLAGIGGTSMHSLGLVLKQFGVEVSGSDMTATGYTDILESKGIPVHIGHDARNIEGAEVIIRSAAIHDDNVEIAAARKNGILVFERAQAWGVIMQAYKNAICIAGTHGKTTTTSLVTHILMEAAWDPTVMVGSYLPLLRASHRIGQGDTIVLESCEYTDSFLNFSPTLAVILNIEEDHLDYFKDLADIQKSFRKFAGLATKGILANGDDPHTLQAIEGMEFTTFGLKEHNTVHAANMCPDWRHFDVICDGEFYCHVDLGVMGKHNAMNALAAAGVAWMIGVPGELTARGLAGYHGASRRMEYKGRYNGADIYDDYAHHPDELAATYSVVKEMGYDRVILVFQPHTYTRTKALFNEFVEVLKPADHVVIPEIFAARETDTLGLSSTQLCAKIPGSVYCRNLEETAAYLREIARPGDMIITLGCGDVYRTCHMLMRYNYNGHI